MEIRPEEERDFSQVYRLNSLAFEGEAEANLVAKLRKAKIYFSLVAEIDGKIAGHIAFSTVTLNDEPAKFLGLAPMSVAPEFQNQGIGSILVLEGLEMAANQGFAAVFVLGHSHYYPRFGFKTAKPKGFSCEYTSPDEFFMVIELEPGALAGKQGLIKYGPEFAEF